jgi:hypothetical protein
MFFQRLQIVCSTLLSSGGFRNAVCLFINKQQATIVAKEEAEEDFRKLSDPQKESIRAALPRQESTVVKLIKAALVRLSEYNQQYFDSEEQLSKANQNKEYHDIPLCVLITLPCTHPIVQRKNKHYKNRIANTIHGCRRISDFHIALNQTAFKWVQLLLEVLYPKDPFAMSYSDPKTKHTMLNRAREELEHEMNQPDHQYHEQYVHCLALFDKVELEAAVPGSLSRSPSLPPNRQAASLDSFVCLCTVCSCSSLRRNCCCCCHSEERIKSAAEAAAAATVLRKGGREGGEGERAAIRYAIRVAT